MPWKIATLGVWATPNTGWVWWGGGCLAIGLLLVVMFFVLRNRWVQAKALAKNPFSKYIALSVVAHLVLAIAAYFAHVFEPADVGDGGAAVMVQFGEDAQDDLGPEENTWETPTSQVAEVPPADLPADETPSDPIHRPVRPMEDTRVESPLADMPLDSEPGLETSPQLPPSELPTDVTPIAADTPPPLLTSPPVEQEARPNELVQSNAPTNLDEQPSTLAQLPEEVMEPAALVGRIDDLNPLRNETRQDPIQNEAPRKPLVPVSTNALPPQHRSQHSSLQPTNVPWGRSNAQASSASPPRRTDGSDVPDIYRDRWADDRLQLARLRGGDANTEAAVREALRWLAAVQGPDGRWDASQFGSGRVREREYAGRNADTGITGLAILAFLGSGHTHRSGDYQKTVQQGIDFLLAAQQQRTDGSLIGNAGTFAAMYCHGISTLALSESYGLTRDPTLRTPVNRAIDYTISSQHRTTGGWRYRPQEMGDTSQLGWQLMALTSAHHSGAAIPSTTWDGAHRFLNSVSSGRYLGKAAYQPRGQATPSMTAEALMCRLFLGTRNDDPLTEEAADFLMRDLPGRGRTNYYYWYYGTLSLFHLQNAQWQTWNTAVKREIISRQQRTGTLAGSWDPDSIWGTSGGRVYTTALAALTLEVYYRYQPISDQQFDRTARRNR